jgi:hypothetical protein
MKNEALIRDPVFQSNLLLWMVKEQPSTGYRIRPFFFENGFRLVYIEQPFAFPEEIARAIEASTLNISKAPEPEMILARDTDKKGLYFEAKADSFTPDSSNSKQARGHLLACGTAFAETLTPLQLALLCYLVPKDCCPPMAECLANLTTELQSAALAPGPHSVHGLEVVARDLVYTWDNAFKQHSGATEDSVAVLHELQDDTDPSPLLLVFSDQDCPNQERAGYYRRVLINQVIAKLVSDLNLLPIEQTYTITARELLQQTTDGTLNYLALDRQRNMIRIVRKNIFDRIASFWRDKSFSPVQLEADRLQINFKDNLAKGELMDWLEDPKRTAFTDQLPPSDQPLLPGIEPPQERVT